MDVIFIKKYRYHQPIFSSCSIVGCSNCEMVFANPMPDEASLHQYNSGYFENAHGGVNVHPLAAAYFTAINLLRVIYVESYAEKNNSVIKNVLEIGPGGGQFAKHWLKRHPGILQYAGVESDKICYTNLASVGVSVYAKTDEINTDARFDLVVISHVLEHSSHPAEFISDCTKLLSTGGILFIEVPCKDCEHKALDEPHLLFFDKKPMQLFLAKSGFTNIVTSYHGNTISDLKKSPSFYKKILTKNF